MAPMVECAVANEYNLNWFCAGGTGPDDLVSWFTTLVQFVIPGKPSK